MKRWSVEISCIIIYNALCAVAFYGLSSFFIALYHLQISIIQYINIVFGLSSYKHEDYKLYLWSIPFNFTKMPLKLRIPSLLYFLLYYDDVSLRYINHVSIWTRNIWNILTFIFNLHRFITDLLLQWPWNTKEANKKQFKKLVFFQSKSFMPTTTF